ncbi:MAG: tyrosine--tRNA ligase [bacterium]
MDHSMEHDLRILLKGVEDVISKDELEGKLSRSRSTGIPLRIKAGFDPTAPDLHLGHTVLIQKMRDFQRLGHEVFFLIGDFTGLIGDPSGRSETRKPLSREQVIENAKTYERQIYKVLDPEKTRIVFNSQWMETITSMDLIRLCSKQTVARMLEREDFRTRFTEQLPISIHEFIYPLIQGYDSVMLKADVELGGTDQRFNLLMGRELQRDYGQPPQVVIMMPILEGLDGVQKMSKSLGNYVGIDELPSDIYGKVMSIDDRIMLRYYRLLTDMEPAEVDALSSRIAEGAADPKEAKKRLAFTLVERFHGPDKAREAQERFEQVHEKRGIPDDIPTFCPPVREQVWLVRFLVDRGLVQSSSQARRMIKQGGVSIDGERVTDEDFALDLSHPCIIKVGKRGFLRVEPK